MIVKTLLVVGVPVRLKGGGILKIDPPPPGNLFIFH